MINILGKSNFEVINCLQSSDDHHLLTVKPKNGNQHYLMKFRKFEEHKAILTRKNHFKRELDFVTIFDHPNILKPITTENGDKSLSIIYPFRKGTTLDKYIHARVNLSIAETLKIVIQLLDALEYIHLRGIIHCDVNPASILIKEDRAIELFDFSYSMTEVEILRRPEGLVTGRYPYLSPEQTGFTGFKIDTRSDLYCAGIILYQLLSNRLPFSSRNDNNSIEELLDLMLKVELEPVKTVPVFLNEILLKSLRSTPDERYQTATGFKYDLKKALELIENDRSRGSLIPGEKDAVIAINRSRFFIAREKEIEILTKGLLALKQNESSSFLLTGPSGIGKSEIIRKFLTTEGLDSVLTLASKCNRFTPTQPYSVFRSLFLDYFSEIQEKDSKEKALFMHHLNMVLLPHAGIICDIIPEIRGYFDTVQETEHFDKERDADRISHVLVTMMDTLCSTISVVIIVDDIQWIDAISFNILMQLKQSHSPKMMIFAYRNEGQFESKIQRCRLDDIAAKRIPVQPFTRNEIGWFIFSIFDSVDNDETLIELLDEKCNGNPFVLNQIIRFLLDSSILKKINGRWIFTKNLDHSLPQKFDSVSLIIHKFENLSEREQKFLKIGSLMEGRLSLQIIEELAGYNEIQSKEILKRLESDGFLMTNFKGVITFSHDKIQEIIINSIPPQERKIIYESLAVEYEILCDSRAEYLFDAAEIYLKTSNYDKAVELSVKAANYAVNKYAYDLAVHHFRMALASLEKISDHQADIYKRKKEIEIGLADVLVLTGKYDQALSIYNRYCQNIDLLECSEIQYKIGCIYHYTGEYNFAEKFFRDALKKIGMRIPHTLPLIIAGTFIEIIKLFFNEYFFSKIRYQNENTRDILAAKILNKYSQTLFLEGFLRAVFPHFKALNVLHKIKNTGVRIETSVLHGLITHLFQFKKRSQKFIRKAEAECTGNGVVNCAYVKSIRGFVELLNTQWQKSETSLLDCINNYKSLGDDNGQISCLNYIWKLQYLKGNFQRASSYLKLIIEMCNKNGQNHYLRAALEANTLVDSLMGVSTENVTNSFLSSKNGQEHLTDIEVELYKIERHLLYDEIESAWKSIIYVSKAIKMRQIDLLLFLRASSLKCELLIMELNRIKSGEKPLIGLSEKIILTQIKNVLSGLYLRRNVSQLVTGYINRISAWYFFAKSKKQKADSLFNAAIKNFHELQMKYEEAKTIRDYGIFLELNNLCGAAQDQFNAAFTVLEKCGAKTASKRLADKISHEFKESRVEKETKSIIVAPENTNQIRFDTILQVSSLISEIDDISVLLNQILTALIKATGAQYGCVFIKQPDGQIRKSLLRDFLGNELDESDIIISHPVVEKTVKDMQIVVNNDVAADRYSEQNETARIRSVLCVPLYRESNFMGCVYLGNNKVAGLFSDNAVKTAQILSTQASILLENAFLMEKHKELNNELNKKVKQQTHDILEKNRQLEDANLKLVESERVKGVLSGTLVHDIKNYAAGIEGNLQYLGRRFESDVKVKRILDVVSETCTDIVSLASNLLDIGKMDEGKLVMKPELIKAFTIMNLAQKFQTNTLFEEKEIVPQIIPPDNDYSIKADPYLLERVFQNLFSNAAKYVPKNGIVKLSFSKDVHRSMICFYNSGIPIPDHEKEALFDKYARIENRNSQYSKGLGLFFCRMVMNAHKGKIWVDTDETGNYFRLVFPFEEKVSIS